jgi:hypothetical protein
MERGQATRPPSWSTGTKRGENIVLVLSLNYASLLSNTAMGTLRGEIIPEKHRAGIMNW